jgi:predicted HicB family RNase H-like nuclease
MNMNEHYTYRVTWSPEEGEFLGTCAEFPHLSHFDENPEAALAGIREVVRAASEALRDHGHPVPEPFAERKFSGKFVVRVPPQVHRALVLEASEQGVSLNRLISARLTG